MSNPRNLRGGLIPDDTTTPDKSEGGITIAGTPPPLPSLPESSGDAPEKPDVVEAQPVPVSVSVPSTGPSSRPSAKEVPEKPEPAPRKRTQKSAPEDVGIDVRALDLLLPRSTILRLAKDSVPDRLAMHRDAVVAINRAATVFISALAHNANMTNAKRRTIKSEDVYDALHEMEFDAFVPRVQKETDVYVARAADHQAQLRRDKMNREAKALDNFMKQKAAMQASSMGSLGRATGDNNNAHDERATSKRVKRDDGTKGSTKFEGAGQFDGAGSALSATARQGAQAARGQRADHDEDVEMSDAEEDDDVDDGHFDAEDNDDDDIDDDPNIVVVGSDDDEDEEGFGGRGNRRGIDEELDEMPVEDIDGHSRRKRVINPDYAGDDDDDGSQSD
ncbi:hypothetical protein KEM56_001879 [Ascosphaera pollenicola]|nr:hypothetical protein KEM56_001879 [Ascosphaera pollenicola]